MFLISRSVGNVLTLPVTLTPSATVLLPLYEITNTCKIWHYHRYFQWLPGTCLFRSLTEYYMVVLSVQFTKALFFASFRHCSGRQLCHMANNYVTYKCYERFGNGECFYWISDLPIINKLTNVCIHFDVLLYLFSLFVWWTVYMHLLCIHKKWPHVTSRW